MHDPLFHWIRHYPSAFRSAVFVLSFGLGLAVLVALPDRLTLASRVALGWDLAIVFGIVAILTTLPRLNVLSLRAQLEVTTLRQPAFSAFLVLCAGISIVATIWVLRVASRQAPWAETGHLLLAGGTVLITFVAVQCLFADMYMHLYYRTLDHDGGSGLKFPETEDPNYWDFLYFAVCTGMTFQVSDVSTQTRTFRKWVTFHGLFSFLFASINVALLVDIAANLVGS